MSDLLPAAWTNYGALTSVFTPPADCSQLTIAFPTQAVITESLEFPITTTELPHLYFFNPAKATSCYPSQYSTFQNPSSVATTTDGTITSKIIPTATSAYFSPGRCPEGWKTRILDFNFIPASHTLAACCPSFTEAPEISHRDLEKRGGGSGKGRPRKHTTATHCNFYLPTRTTSTSAPTITDLNKLYGSVTAVANGSLTTMAPSEWFSIGGTSTGAFVYATGINVMWKHGDFPDIDAAASLVSASASASASAAEAERNSYLDHDPPGLSRKNAIIIVVCVVVFVLLILAFTFTRCLMKMRGTGIRAACMVLLKRRFAKGGTAGAGTGGRKSEDGLLGSEAAGASGASNFRINRRDDIESAPTPVHVDVSKTEQVMDEIPPPYAAAPSEPADTTSTGNTRMWNETSLEYEERRLKERKEILLERIKLAREEDNLRARMRERGP